MRKLIEGRITPYSALTTALITQFNKCIDTLDYTSCTVTVVCLLILISVNEINLHKSKKGKDPWL